MTEKGFDFSKLEDQQKFEQLPHEEKEEGYWRAPASVETTADKQEEAVEQVKEERKKGKIILKLETMARNQEIIYYLEQGWMDEALEIKNKS